jgi:endo-1,4-beta-xylanase
MSRIQNQLVRWFLPLMSLLFLITAKSVSAQTVTNGSFESCDTGVVDSGSVKGWLFLFDQGITPPPVFQIVSDTVEQGNRALEVTVHGLGQNQWSIQVVADSIHVKPGVTYNYSIWAKASKPGAQVNFTVGNYSYNEYAAIRPANLTTQWQKYTMQFTVNDGQTVIRAPIHLNFVADTGNAIYIDNLQILDVNASKEPVIVEAESGVLGSGISVGTDSATSTTYITPDSNYTGFVPGDSSRVATYQVTFPDSGTYALYARVRVGPNGYNSDSFFYGNGFGEKNDTATADWVFVNGLASAGFTDSASVVYGPGTAGTGVWKWVNVTLNTYQGTPGDSFYVSPDSLTQTFQIASRESGLEIDKFAFAKSNLFFTVWQLDNGLPGTTKNPMDSSLFYKGPPLAQGQGKFLGCAYGDVPDNVFANYWNQLTPGNAGKWGSVAVSQDTTKWNWTGLDYAYNYAMTHHEIFKDHNLVWGQQQPTWISSLDSAQQIQYITTWFRMVGQRYPNINMVDVVNEPLPGHNPPDGQNGRANYEGALGGPGATGWDWVINAFALARKYLPQAKLLINDYGIINDNTATTQYLQIINLLKDRGLIDGIGVQCHRFEIETADTNVLKSNLARLGATGLPVYISEMDLGNIGNTGTPNDNMQLQLYQKYFPIFWNNPAVKGITLWGYLQGQMWQTTCYLVNSDGSSRPALQWLTQYIKDNPTGVVNTASNLPTSFNLDQNYPNPFNPTTTIRYQLPAKSYVTLKVYDVLGRLIATLVDGVQTPGVHEVSFDGSRYASGVYLYRFTAPGVNIVKKMLMVK